MSLKSFQCLGAFLCLSESINFIVITDIQPLSLISLIDLFVISVLKLKKPRKKIWGSNGIRTHDRHDTGTMLYQPSYEAWLEAGQVQVQFISIIWREWGDVYMILVIFIVYTSPQTCCCCCCCCQWPRHEYNLEKCQNWTRTMTVLSGLVFSCSVVLGMVTLGNIMSQIVAGRITPESPISQCIYKQFNKVRKFDVENLYYFSK